MFEKEFIKNHHKYLLGTDEVGRGPLAGPVVSACVRVKITRCLFNDLESLMSLGVTDSKKLNDKKREEIVEYFLSVEDLKKNQVIKIADHIDIVISEIGEKIIDEINILQSSLKSMKDSVDFFNLKDDSVLFIDGNKKISNLSANFDSFPIVKGDSKSVVIGLASIFAKVYRDKLMQKWDEIYPGYGFSNHAGYPTKAHLNAIKELGVTPIHRKTFKGVKEYVKNF